MNQKHTARKTAYTAMGAALITICAWIAVPTAVPFTMQTFAVCLIAALFGAKQGVFTVGGYLLLGLLGLPVFSGFRGGAGVLAGVTGGYLVGFLVTALTVGVAVERFGRKLTVLCLSMAAGILLCYAFGTAWFVVAYGKANGSIGIGTALGWCVIPYLLPDAAKIALAAALTIRLYPHLPGKNG
ncbi:MAG: biotin transporter BioY [Clostridia bacterium]|nr:biotin transporter BioY [Clostridia bacterium]